MAAVSMTYFGRILELVEEQGVSRQDCLNAIGLELLDETSPKARISMAKTNIMLNFAAEVLNDPLIGIRCGRQFRIPKFTKMGNIIALCNDISHAAEVNRRYAPLVHTVGAPSVVVKDETGHDKIVWVPNFDPQYYAKFRQITEYVMTNYVTSLDWLAWSTGKGIESLRLAHKPYAPKSRYEEMLRCHVEFEAGEYSVLLSEGVANAPLPMASPSQFALLKARQERILASYLQSDNLIYRVEQSIREQIEIAKPSLKNTAKDLGLGERSMRRFLGEQDTSFKTIFENVKKDLSITMIKNGFTYSEVAQALWYSDQPAFTRAYKKWFGVPPSQHERY